MGHLSQWAEHLSLNGRSIYGLMGRLNVLGIYDLNGWGKLLFRLEIMLKNAGLCVDLVQN